jgi:hypothetical protein
LTDLLNLERDGFKYIKGGNWWVIAMT